MDSSSQNNLPGSDTGIRRSERCRTVSSIYAKSIDEFKKSLKKPDRSSRYQEDDSNIHSNQRDDQCSMDLEENWLACKLPEGEAHRMIYVNVVSPKKSVRPNRTGEIRGSQMIKKRSSAFKEPPKQVEKKQSYLLGILLGAAMKVAQGPHEEQQESANHDKQQQSETPAANGNEKMEQTSNVDPQKRLEGKQRSRLAERDEDIKRLNKMQAKFNSQSARFEQLKNKMSIRT